MPDELWTEVRDIVQETGNKTIHKRKETIMQRLKKDPGSPEGTYITIFLGSSGRTKASTQVEDDNFRLSPRFLAHHPVTLPARNQKEVTHPTAFTPNFAFKNFSQNHHRVWGFAGTRQRFSPAISFSLSQMPKFLFV